MNERMTDSSQFDMDCNDNETFVTSDRLKSFMCFLYLQCTYGDFWTGLIYCFAAEEPEVRGELISSERNGSCLS